MRNDSQGKHRTLILQESIVGQIFNETLPRARKERQIAPQASAGYPLSINSLLAVRKAERGRIKKLRTNSRTPSPQSGRDMCLMIASNPAKAGFSSGTLKSQDILNIPALWPSTNLEMILNYQCSVIRKLILLYKWRAYRNIEIGGLFGVGYTAITEAAKRGRLFLDSPKVLAMLPR